jgi:hypothetical protein
MEIESLEKASLLMGVFWRSCSFDSSASVTSLGVGRWEAAREKFLSDM